MNWMIKFFLTPTTNSYEYAMNSKKQSFYKKHFFLWLFVSFSFIAIASTLILSTFSTLKLAKVWIFSEDSKNNEQINQIIDNYVYIVNIITASVSLLSSISAFFTFKEGYAKNRVLYKKLDFEIYQYDNQIGFYSNKGEKERKSVLTDRIFSILNQAQNINEIDNLKRGENV